MTGTRVKRDDNASMPNVTPVCGTHARRKKAGAGGARHSLPTLGVDRFSSIDFSSDTRCR